MKQVILMRTDLDMSVGKMCAQAAHAVLEPKAAVIVLQVPSEEELIRLLKLAANATLRTNMVCDAGHTEVPKGTLTCGCIGPAEDIAIDKITGQLKTL